MLGRSPPASRHHFYRPDRNRRQAPARLACPKRLRQAAHPAPRRGNVRRHGCRNRDCLHHVLLERRIAGRQPMGSVRPECRLQLGKCWHRPDAACTRGCAQVLPPCLRQRRVHPRHSAVCGEAVAGCGRVDRLFFCRYKNAGTDPRRALVVAFNAVRGGRSTRMTAQEPAAAKSLRGPRSRAARVTPGCSLESLLRQGIVARSWRGEKSGKPAGA